MLIQPIPAKIRSIPRMTPSTKRLETGHCARIMPPTSTVMTPESATHPQGVPSFICIARKMRRKPDTIEGNSEHQCQDSGGQDGVLESQQASDDVKGTEQHPQEELAPAPHAEGANDLGDSADQHHDAHDSNRNSGGHHNAAEGNKTRDEEHNAKCDNPAPLNAQWLEASVQNFWCYGRHSRCSTWDNPPRQVARLIASCAGSRSLESHS